MSTAARFRDLHGGTLFVMPNAWDLGSARLLESLGFAALATTSSGHAGTLGRVDQRVRRDELLVHAEQMASAVEVPVNVDSEGCFPDEPGGVRRTVELLAAAGAAGCSIEDVHPEHGLLPVEVAVERVSEAAAAARHAGLVLTARAENHLYGIDDLDDTIGRLVAYRNVGADVAYAPGLTEAGAIARVIHDVGGSVNVLAMPGVPAVPALAELGVTRVSTGGSLAWVAYGALVEAGRELLDRGTTSYLAHALGEDVRRAAFADRVTPTGRLEAPPGP